MRTGVSNAPDTFDLARTPQEISEERLTAIEIEVSAVRVDILSEQRDLNNAVRGQALNLSNDVAGAAADLGAPNDRDDAESATVVASGGDGHPRRVVGLPPRRHER